MLVALFGEKRKKDVQPLEQLKRRSVVLRNDFLFGTAEIVCIGLFYQILPILLIILEFFVKFFFRSQLYTKIFQFSLQDFIYFVFIFISRHFFQFDNITITLREIKINCYVIPVKLNPFPEPFYGNFIS